MVSGHASETISASGFLLTSPIFPRIAMETYIRQRQLIMSPLITSHVIGENEPLTSVLNKVIAAKEVNHKGQGMWPVQGEGTLARVEENIQSKVPALPFYQLSDTKEPSLDPTLLKHLLLKILNHSPSLMESGLNVEGSVEQTFPPAVCPLFPELTRSKCASKLCLRSDCALCPPEAYSFIRFLKADGSNPNEYPLIRT